MFCAFFCFVLISLFSFLLSYDNINIYFLFIITIIKPNAEHINKLVTIGKIDCLLAKQNKRKKNYVC